jgi:hypothetical protein
MKPVLDSMAPAIMVLQRMRNDMQLAGILARQQAAFAAMAPILPLPTEAEWAETEDRLPELVPSTDEEREQVAQQAAEIEADPEGQNLISQVIAWLNNAVASLGDVAAKDPTEVGLGLIAFLIFFVIPPSAYVAAGFFCAAASAWLAYRALGGK